MVQGLNVVRRQLQAVPAAIEAEVRKALEQTADDVVRQMRAVVEKDTGEGAASIGWTWGDAPKGAMTVGSVGDADKAGRQRPEGLRITIYAGQGDAFHLRFLEFGTRKMPARPFFFPVYRANRNLARRRIGAAIRRAIKAQQK